MSSSDSSSQLEHLKSLVSQLQTKIERLESQAASSASDAKAKVGQAVEGAKETVKGAVGGAKEALTPAQHLRLVLMGPPGAGESTSLHLDREEPHSEETGESLWKFVDLRLSPTLR